MRRYNSQDARRRVLAACARLFLEKGYTKTRMADILKAADVSASSFQNIFHTKDGVLAAFVEIMFTGQFDAARGLTADAPTPAHVYAVETALQLALTELNENLRDIYVEAYTCPEALAIIHRRTAGELQAMFGAYLPGCTGADFHEMEVGTAGMMRAYMVSQCGADFPLERKITRFLTMSLSVFCVPEAERAQIIAYVATLDVRLLARRVMDALFESLSMQFEL
ncbi:MAG: TetR/AcrR family transcriptional regulator [Candidatus Limivivens sp.]|nr:TetR/AcrR family transcriptional regulator [Candidatus Limivivens sp.]